MVLCMLSLSLARANPSAKVEEVVEEVGRDPQAWWEDVRATSSGYGLKEGKNPTILQAPIIVLHSALHSYTLTRKTQQTKNLWEGSNEDKMC